VRRDIECSESGGGREEDACYVERDVLVSDEGDVPRPGGIGVRNVKEEGGRRGVHSLSVHNIESRDAQGGAREVRMEAGYRGACGEDEVRVVGK
jgi:hypothetical protein